MEKTFKRKTKRIQPHFTAIPHFLQYDKYKNPGQTFKTDKRKLESMSRLIVILSTCVEFQLEGVWKIEKRYQISYISVHFKEG